MIEYRNVSKRYPKGHQALSHVDLQVDKGEMVFITGHSGAGKSTLLKLTALIESPSQGHIVVDGQNLQRVPRRRIPFIRRNIGMIFQDAQLLMDHTVYDNVALPMVIAGYHTPEITRRVRAALDMVGLLGREKSLPEDLSGGEQHRVGIARAVVNRPPLLLADEPTGNLDPELAVEIMRLLGQFNQVGVTVLIATHNLALIASMPHRIVTLNHGRLATES